MCDGIISQKLKVIGELMRMERPAEPQEYIKEHMAWTLEELKTYYDQIRPMVSAP
ncbi:hypothetical protein [Methanocella conradii]|uniref:hypothetical protein n=1 Tax=Methanocella conradii TaxID=1175444 RepID=UPI00157E0C7F|nr:hypothetical protein [Methanocella conradii]